MRPGAPFALTLFVLALPAASPGIEPIRIEKFEGYESPCWSHDGHRLAYTWWRRGFTVGKSGSVAVRDLATGQTLVPQCLRVPMFSFVNHPCWSADEASLFVQAGGKQWQATFDAAHLVPVSLPLPAGTRSPSAWSPNGQDHLVILIQNGQTDLWIERPSTGALWQLTNSTDVESEPDWSPDGIHIAYVDTEGSLDSDLVIITDPRLTAVAPMSLSSVKARYR